MGKLQIFGRKFCWVETDSECFKTGCVLFRYLGAPYPVSSSPNRKARAGSREYWDAVKRNRSPTLTPINNTTEIPKNSLFWKHVGSITNLRGKISNTQCTWCVANDLNRNHTSNKCNLIKNANDMDQYNVIYKYRICSSSLGTSYYWRNCPI